MSIPVPASQPGHRAYADSVRLDTGGIVTGLREILGARLVAYLGRVSNTRSVREWAEGSRAPGADVVQRLRTSYYVAGILIECESAKTIQAWFQGMNPELDDQSPAALLRGGPLDEIGPKVISAARSFAAHG
ncbi:hypothetical protein E3T37_09120 [Cryobacterium sp. TMT2-10]|uniref:DUF2384 domain-containing protein n=1 Tax=Cryobacterium shii TaxID=1259235 RepID=A0AAQ2HFY4_9MICO|nr:MULTISPECIES: hypothetical protein [Cryobacterium]TFC48769.1 hypothetical protein E3O49_07015 [Cryobacterium shii]TFC81747.1 hypothetical protein E3T24_14745 [Cryobacterium sp. TmT2-59]TFD17566.1 hypothetical protein E3T42_07330 [Cryobacterium sp. TMT4-10]TFD24836.1 hypothetical protein E3T32_04535 [Cryobacterium sp. TMT2-23]TFD38899.1 hypothetical protein E3T37_09120 [Cryobacterium sp. TMT2-10]